MTDLTDRTIVPGPLSVLVAGTRRDLDPAGPRVSVVVPTLNESRNLPWLAAHMPANVFEMVVVDGRSTDDTVEVARALWPDATIVEQTRRGKGNALACGFAAARGDIIVMIDADGSMDPGEIPYFVDALVAGADYAKGSRFTRGGGSNDITKVRALGNWFLNTVTNVSYKTTYSDLCYGYNAFWTHVLPSMHLSAGEVGVQAGEKLWGDGFEIETLINIRVHEAGLKIAEVASFEAPRLHGVSNLNAVTDGLRVLRTIATERRVARARALDTDPVATQALPTQPAVIDLVAAEQESGRVIDLNSSRAGERHRSRVVDAENIAASG